MNQIKTGIVGATGYTGVELMRILARHPQVEIAAITSRTEAKKPVDEIFPSLRGIVDLVYEHPDQCDLSALDVVFFATPNGIAMQQAPALLAQGVRVIDLAADYRIKDVPTWSQWYGMAHASEAWVEKAVYGLPEMNRSAIATAQLVANPGCYPTAVQLGFMPLVREGLVDIKTLVADAKSGVSGAGRTAAIRLGLSETAESFKAYGAGGHRHLPEITQGISAMSPEDDAVELLFIPHLVPMIRGIHATLYATLNEAGLKVDLEALHALYQDYYRDEPFVDLLPLGEHPDTQNVRGSNRCQIALFRPQGSRRVVILSVIDNLVKGAAGQAVHNMNLMFGFDEASGLGTVPLYP